VTLAASIIATIVVSEVSYCADLICKWIIIWSATILGWATNPAIGSRYRGEWLALIPDMPGKLLKILTTLTIPAAIPHMWWILVGQTIPANLSRAIAYRLTGWRRARNSPKPGVRMARLDKRHVAMRSRDGVLVFDDTEFRYFLMGAKNGEFNLEMLTRKS
jgi:hypothetical protein